MVAKVSHLYPETASSDSQEPSGCMSVRAIVEFRDESGQGRFRKVTLRTDWGVTVAEGKQRAKSLREQNPHLPLAMHLRMDL